MTSRPIYEVNVGNIGTIYCGDSYRTALKHFVEYIDQSKSEVGRASGESVVLARDGEPIREYIGTLEE